ncbi:acyl carrier protein [Micromonospora echinofusca]|uniref:acyl carrier protein n=1 Tax=Micromonospora echinofusca TaxID=47858 RepID=UPI0033DF118E
MTGAAEGAEDSHQRILVALVRARGFPQADGDDDLLALGLTSLDLLQLGADIEKEFGVPVDLGVLLAAPSIDSLAGVLRGGAQDEAAAT